MVSLLNGEADFGFTISMQSLALTLKVFGEIFLLILIKCLIQVSNSRPIELLKSEAVRKASKGKLVGRNFGRCDSGRSLLYCRIY